MVVPPCVFAAQVEAGGRGGVRETGVGRVRVSPSARPLKGCHEGVYGGGREPLG